MSYETRDVPSVWNYPTVIEKLLLIGPAPGIDAGVKPARFADLANERLILPGNRHCLCNILEECAAQAGVKLNPVIEVDSLSAMIALVRSGFGSTILPLPPVHHLIKQRLLSVRPIIDPQPERTVVIAVSSLRPISPAARFVWSTFRQIVVKMVGNRAWIGDILTDE